MKVKVAFAAALILAVAAAIGTKALITSYQRQIHEQAHNIPVAEATKNMRPGDVLLEDSFRIVSIPGKLTNKPPVTKTDLSRFIGQKLVEPVLKGDILYQHHFIKSAVEIEFPRQVGIGYRALTIPVDQVSGVAGLIHPRDRVDILATMAYQTSGPNGPRSSLETMTLLENVTVLAIDDRTAEHASLPARYRRDSRSSYTTVTISVTPEQARIITLAQAQSQGMLTLVLRNPAETSNSPGRLNSEELWQKVLDASNNQPGSETENVKLNNE